MRNQTQTAKLIQLADVGSSVLDSLVLHHANQLEWQLDFSLLLQNLEHGMVLSEFSTSPPVGSKKSPSISIDQLLDSCPSK